MENTTLPPQPSGIQPFLDIPLIRYLIVWRVTDTLVRAPTCLSAAISETLGEVIAERLPTSEAREWRKTREAWQNPAPPAPGLMAPPKVAAPWPIHAVLFPYPGKQVYGQGEAIVWELKLLGPHADHGLFLETLLPAMEALGVTTERRWRDRQDLWGHFDVQAVYAARGAQWKPVVEDGKVNLRARVSPIQWREGLTFGLDAPRPYSRLMWVTSFDLGEGAETQGSKGAEEQENEQANKRKGEKAKRGEAKKRESEKAKREERQRRRQKITDAEIPTLYGLVGALVNRVTPLLPGKRPSVEQAWAQVDPADVWALINAEDPTALTPEGEELQITLQSSAFTAPPKGWPGKWIGKQFFSASLPARLLPYLELASILHVGKDTHFGCGTFRLE